MSVSAQLEIETYLEVKDVKLMRSSLDIDGIHLSCLQILVL
jgi:hypothetical protein